jgi:hypothetical protein
MRTLREFEASKDRELNDTGGVQLSASEFRWLCDLAQASGLDEERARVHQQWLKFAYGPLAMNAARP